MVPGLAQDWGMGWGSDLVGLEVEAVPGSEALGDSDRENHIVWLKLT